MDQCNNVSKEITQTLLLHVDQIFHQRVNILLLSEAIFIAAFATLIDSQHFFLSGSICLLGFLITAFLNWTLIRHNTGFSWLADQIKILDETKTYEKYTEVGKNEQKFNNKINIIFPRLKDIKLGSFTIFIYILPSLFLAFWFVSFLYVLVFWLKDALS